MPRFVRLRDQTEHALVGRVEMMEAYLVIYQERINAAPRGSLTFHFDARSLKPDLHEFWDSVSSAA